MDTLTKKRKRGNKNFDRLSDMPDFLLTEILSLLKAREVAQTCILSKRWRNLWASVPCLHFDFDDFKRKPEKFHQIVSSFLSLRNGTFNVHTFRLNYHITNYRSMRPLVETWILYACEHKLTKLEIILTGMFAWYAPCCILTSDSLEHMHLGGALLEADSVCLPKLKNLSLCRVKMNDHLVEKILCGCPALHILRMKRFTFQAIKRLTLEICYFCACLSEAARLLKAWSLGEAGS